MSEFKGMTLYGRRVRLAAMVVCAALVLPGLAVANHTTCDKQSNEVGGGINCPEFSPGLEASVSNPVVDSESTLSYDYSQADHESATMLIEAYAPKHWQFNTQIRPSAIAGACTGSAEAISGNSWRLRSLANANRAVTNRTGAAYFSDYNAGTQTITGCARVGGTNLPFTISRLAPSHPYAADHDWKISISTRAFIESIASQQGSMTNLVFDFNQRTSGTWHLNQSLQLERAIFSQASHTPVTTDLRVDATTCRRGLNSGSPNGCGGAGNETIKVTVANKPFNISPAPTGTPLEFAKPTGPNRIPGTTAENTGSQPREGFGLVNGGNTAIVTWNQPPANPNETVKGYVVVVAIPGNEGSQSGRYLLKVPTCGALGTGACSTTLTAGSLPRLDGNGSLHPDVDAGGKYDVALITVYDSGKRSDGRCDDGTWQGVLCAPTTPLWQVNAGGRIGYPDAGRLGTSYWQFLWRTHAYPSVAVETSSNQPFMLLFTDYSIKEAEFVIFGSYLIKTGGVSGSGIPQTRYIAHGDASDGPATSFKNRDNRIIGDGDTGVVSFSNNASPTGTAVRFDYTGETDPSGTYGLVTLTEPGDFNLGSTIPPSPTSRRQMGVAMEFMEGGSI